MGLLGVKGRAGGGTTGYSLQNPNGSLVNLGGGLLGPSRGPGGGGALMNLGGGVTSPSARNPGGTLANLTGGGLMGKGFGTMGLSERTRRFIRGLLNDATNSVQTFDQVAQEAGAAQGIKVSSTGTSDEELALIRAQVGPVEITSFRTGPVRDKGIQQTTEAVDWDATVEPSPPPVDQQQATFLRLDPETGRPVVLAGGKELFTTFTIGSTAVAPGQSVLVTTINGQAVMETPEQAKRRTQKRPVSQEPGKKDRPPAPLAIVPWMARLFFEFAVRIELDPRSGIPGFDGVQGIVTLPDGSEATVDLDVLPLPATDHPDLLSVSARSVETYSWGDGPEPTVDMSSAGNELTTYIWTEQHHFSFRRDGPKFYVHPDPIDPSAAIVSFFWRVTQTWSYLYSQREKYVVTVEAPVPSFWSDPVCNPDGAPWTPIITGETTNTWTLLEQEYVTTAPVIYSAALKVSPQGTTPVSPPQDAIDAFDASLFGVDELEDSPTGAAGYFGQALVYTYATGETWARDPQWSVTGCSGSIYSADTGNTLVNNYVTSPRYALYPLPGVDHSQQYNFDGFLNTGSDEAGHRYVRIG